SLVDHFQGPLFVTHYTVDQKPFYMKRNGEGEAECFGLLCPFVGKLGGGSLRVSTSAELLSQSPDNKSHKTLMVRCSLRVREQVKSGEFGIGFERLLQMMLDIRNIKD
ncbi:hypothetical protein PENTCL1PPCAC_12957, partial [Pristionchus entomophagus]